MRLRREGEGGVRYRQTLFFSTVEADALRLLFAAARFYMRLLAAVKVGVNSGPDVDNEEIRGALPGCVSYN